MEGKITGRVFFAAVLTGGDTKVEEAIFDEVWRRAGELGARAVTMIVR